METVVIDLPNSFVLFEMDFSSMIYGMPQKLCFRSEGNSFVLVIYLGMKRQGAWYVFLKFNHGCKIDNYCSINILPLVEKDGGGTNYVKTVVK